MKCKCQPEGKVCARRIGRDCPGIRTNMGIMCLSSLAIGFPIVLTDRFNGNGNNSGNDKVKMPAKTKIKREKARV